MINETLLTEANGVCEDFITAVTDLDRLATLRALESGSDELAAEVNAASTTNAGRYARFIASPIASHWLRDATIRNGGETVNRASSDGRSGRRDGTASQRGA